ncbi:MAG TPA: histidine--tRNA ligase [Parafilimonas sp.]|nr:histidine--tRNA ligase [Parafilimonas sp.]
MKPSIPQGTRDFNAETLGKRNYIFQTIKNVFELYGFQPLETPAFENLETLMGKYGDEGDQLLFKILNNGLNRIEKREQIKTDFEKILEGKNTTGITERALRYDLTIPFARYVAMNSGQLNFPFKRYQIQPVWRADRPQKGRYREFYQCDADIVGSNSLLNETELSNIYIDVFEKLNIDVEIKINNRKILSALAEVCNKPESLTDITVAIDKLDKIGLEKVKEELKQRNLNDDEINIIEKYLLIDGDNQTKIDQLKNLFGDNESAKKGIDELEYVLNYQPKLKIDFTLARGLNYYTGIIFEVKAKNVSIGSIGGGGRYDDLTGLFGVPNLPGVGISFGVDRIYDVMQELNLFPANVNTAAQVLFFNLGEAEVKAAYTLMQQLRSNNIRCEIYPDKAKFDKQFKYAERKNILYTIIIGSKEIETNTCIIKNIKTGEQQNISQKELATFSF